MPKVRFSEGSYYFLLPGLYSLSSYEHDLKARYSFSIAVMWVLRLIYFFGILPIVAFICIRLFLALLPNPSVAVLVVAGAFGIFLIVWAIPYVLFRVIVLLHVVTPLWNIGQNTTNQYDNQLAAQTIAAHLQTHGVQAFDVAYIHALLHERDKIVDTHNGEINPQQALHQIAATRRLDAKVVDLIDQGEEEYLKKTGLVV